MKKLKNFIRVSYDTAKSSKLYVIDCSRLDVSKKYLMTVYEMKPAYLVNQYYVWQLTKDDVAQRILDSTSQKEFVSGLTNSLNEFEGSKILNINNRRRSKFKDISGLLGEQEDVIESLSIKTYDISNDVENKSAICYIGSYDKDYHIELIELDLYDKNGKTKLRKAVYIYGVNVLFRNSSFNNNILKDRVHSVNGEKIYGRHVLDSIKSTNDLLINFLDYHSKKATI